MAGTTFSERLGLAQRVLEWLEGHREELAEAGLNPDRWIAKLEKSIEALVRADVLQESLKAQLRRETETVRRLDRETYTIAAGAIDATVGAYGKGTEQATQVARMRSQLHRRPREEPKA